jgi:hypothetical protein
MVEAMADYTVKHPVSYVENVGDGLCFAIEGKVYKIDDDKNIVESNTSEVSNTFRVIATLLESSATVIDGHDITVTAGNSTYTISESDKCVKESNGRKETLNSQQLRENNRLVLMTANPRFRTQLANVLEGIALMVENYNNIANMDNVNVYTTKNDRFIVIEGEDKLYASLLASNRHPQWTINENAVDALTFIKAKTNVNISENYSKMVQKHIEEVSEKEQETIKQELHEQKVMSFKERIANLTEKFKDDPTKLAVLSNLAAELMDAEA